MRRGRRAATCGDVHDGPDARLADGADGDGVRVLRLEWMAEVGGVVEMSGDVEVGRKVAVERVAVAGAVAVAVMLAGALRRGGRAAALDVRVGDGRAGRAAAAHLLARRARVVLDINITINWRQTDKDKQRMVWLIKKRECAGDRNDNSPN